MGRKIRILGVFLVLVLIMTSCAKGDSGTNNKPTDEKSTIASENKDNKEEKKIDLSGLSDEEAAQKLVQLLVDGKAEEYFNTTQSMETMDYQRIVVGESQKLFEKLSREEKDAYLETQSKVSEMANQRNADFVGQEYDVAEEYVEFTETGYNIEKYYTGYGGFVENKSQEKAIYALQIDINLLDKDNNVVASSMDTITYLKQGETRPFVGTVNNPEDKSIEVKSVEFKVSKGTTAKAFTEEYLEQEDFEIKDLKQAQKIEMSDIVGTVVNKTEKTSDFLEVIVLIRKDGKIAGGSKTGLAKMPPKGELTFQTSVSHNFPLEDIEVYIYEASPKIEDMKI
ncbi:FxLYD domain-containing protein [Lagierella sp.]|uniref:FxLYD domain-containing protein n=1 Tax=Lagierella sp. TaxID=2849657 RepID=UPI002630D00A|nr:FxLYD domain-containing protein [Lagierella sp.]